MFRISHSLARIGRPSHYRLIHCNPFVSTRVLVATLSGHPFASLSSLSLVDKKLSEEAAAAVFPVYMSHFTLTQGETHTHARGIRLAISVSSTTSSRYIAKPLSEVIRRHCELDFALSPAKDHR